MRAELACNAAFTVIVQVLNALGLGPDSGVVPVDRLRRRRGQRAFRSVGLQQHGRATAGASRASCAPCATHPRGADRQSRGHRHF